MKRIIRSIPSILLVLILSFGLAGCQSTASVDAQTVPEIVLPAVPAAPQEEVPQEEPVPVADEPETITYTLAGYELTFVIGDGYVDLLYPSIVTDDDAAAFFAYEVEKYGSMADGITYSFIDGGARLNLPASVDSETAKAYVQPMFQDITSYVMALSAPKAEAPAEEPAPAVAEPEAITYTLAGYELTFVIGDGYVDLLYPSIVTDSDAAAFFAYGVEKYGSLADGITYSFIDGGARLNLPASVDSETAKAYVQPMFQDITAYVMALSAPKTEKAPAVAEEIPAEEPAPAVAEPETITYTLAGYELTFVIGDGYVDLLYPSIVTDDDAAAFFAYEVEKYGSLADGITYSFIDGGARLNLPASVDSETAKAYVQPMFQDITAYVMALSAPKAEAPAVAEEAPAEEAAPAVAEPEAITYTLAGYELTFVIGDGYVDLLYPSIVTDDDAAAFFAYEVEKYGSMADGITYSFIDGGARLNLPASVDSETAKAYVQPMFQDITAYVMALSAPKAEAPAVAEEAPAEEAAPAVAEPEAITYTLAGYELTFVIGDGYVDLLYPSIVTDDDAAAFFAYEVEKYGSMADGITYSFIDGGARLNLPASVDSETAKAYVQPMFQDITAYVMALSAPKAEAPAEEAAPAVAEPEAITYTLAGYELTFVIGDGYVDLLYPSIVTDDDAAAFFAYEVEKYGSLADGITYSFIDGGARLNLPASVDSETAKAYVQPMFQDITAYVMALSAPKATEAVEVASVAEPAAEVPVVYPFGVDPVVKNTQGDKEFDLFIVHTNDVHGRIVEGEDGSMGYSKLSTLLKMVRSITDNVLLLDAGDVLHGTNLANIFEGQTVAELLDMLGYDAVAPGNHDFNYGAERLEGIARWAEDNASYRVISANITDEDGYLIFQPYQIYDFNGFKVCVIGLTTPDTKTKSHPKNTEGLDFLNDVVIDNAQYAIDLAHELADFVVVLGHLGVVPDGESGITSEYVCENLDGIDLFIDGHSHTVMDGGEVVNGTVITSTGNYLQNLGVVQIHVDGNDAEISDVFLIPAEDVIDPASSELFASIGITSIPSDPDVDAYIAEKQAELDDRFGAVIADLPMDLDGERANVRTRKTNLSKLICQAMTAESGADFTIVNGGGIRASLSAGPVTIGNVNDVLPFTNIITVCSITPAGVYEALEHGYSLLPEQNGAFSQTDLSVVYSASAPAGERIKKVLLNGTVLDRNDTVTEYKVATNDFMAAGGDGYTMFGNVLSEGSMLNEVFMDYISGLYPVR